MKLAFLPIEKPAPPRPRSPDSSSCGSTAAGVHLEQRLAHRAVAAEPLVHGDRVEVGLVDVREQDARLVHSSPSSSSLEHVARERIDLLAGVARAGRERLGDRPVRRRPLGGRRVHVGGLRPRATGRLELRRARARPRAAAPGSGTAKPGSSSPRPGSTVSPAFSWRISLGRVLDRQRADVAPVEGRHRRHVAGAEALELAQVHVVDALRVAPPRRAPRRPGARCARGRPRSCTRTRSGCRVALGAQHVVEGRDAREVGRRHLHHRRHLADRLGRAPAVHASGPPRAPAASPSGGRDRGGISRSISARSASGHVDLGRDRGSSRGRPRGRPPRPSRAGASSRGSRPRRAPPPCGRPLSGPPRRGSGRASPRR